MNQSHLPVPTDPPKLPPAPRSVAWLMGTSLWLVAMLILPTVSQGADRLLGAEVLARMWVALSTPNLASLPLLLTFLAFPFFLFAVLALSKQAVGMAMLYAGLTLVCTLAFLAVDALPLGANATPARIEPAEGYWSWLTSGVLLWIGCWAQTPPRWGDKPKADEAEPES